MTTVKINDNWKIEIDKNNNHQLVRWTEGGTISRGLHAGKQTPAKWLELESYHKDMQSALRAIVKIEIQEQGKLSLAEYINQLDNITDKLLNAKLEVEK